MVFLAELPSVASCDCTAVLLLNTGWCLLLSTPAITTGDTNKHSLQPQLRADCVLWFKLFD